MCSPYVVALCVVLVVLLVMYFKNNDNCDHFKGRFYPWGSFEADPATLHNGMITTGFASELLVRQNAPYTGTLPDDRPKMTCINCPTKARAKCAL